MDEIGRVIAVLTKRPSSRFDEALTAAEIYEKVMPDKRGYGWVVSDELPEGVSIAVADQLSTHLRNTGPLACYMIVYGFDG